MTHVVEIERLSGKARGIQASLTASGESGLHEVMRFVESNLRFSKLHHANFKSLA